MLIIFTKVTMIVAVTVAVEYLLTITLIKLVHWQLMAFTPASVRIGQQCREAQLPLLMMITNSETLL